MTDRLALWLREEPRVRACKGRRVLRMTGTV